MSALDTRQGGPDDNDAQAGHLVAYGLRSDAPREGEAKTPSADAEGRIRLRDPGFNVLEEQAPTIDAGQPHIVAHTLNANYGRTTDAAGTNGSGPINLVYNPARTLQPDGTVIESFKADEITDALHGPTGNKEPLVGGVRRLTPLECERLQGFPDGWTAGESDSTRYRMLGNAVCVPVAEWIGRRLMEAHLQSSTREET